MHLERDHQVIVSFLNRGGTSETGATNFFGMFTAVICLLSFDGGSIYFILLETRHGLSQNRILLKSG